MIAGFIFFLSIFYRIVNMLGHNTSLNKFKRIGITFYDGTMFCGYSGIILRIDNRKNKENFQIFGNYLRAKEVTKEVRKYYELNENENIEIFGMQLKQLSEGYLLL